jgi:Glycosyl hydrolases family 35
VTTLQPPRAVQVVPGRGLDVGGQVVPLVSGAVHYWRLDRARWPQILDRVLDLGFRMIETYVPWSVHEEAPGRFDFTGDRDIEAFAALAADKGLHLIVRPGPHINSELPDYGFPRRVLWDPQCQALSPLGTPVLCPSPAHYFPAPSYASPVFLSEVSRWYDEVVPRLAALQAPNGPVVACQVDNEMAYFFHVDAFAMDYHPAFVAQWREWSGGRWPDAPTGPGDDPERVASWIRFKEQHRLDALGWLADGLRERGMDGVPLFHNDFPAHQTPIDQATVERSGVVDLAGNDLYIQRDAMEQAKLLSRTLAGSSVLPYIPEFGAGWIADPTAIPQKILAEDKEIALLTALLCGVRAWNFYMLVERQLWYGSPISRHGELRPDADLHAKANALLAELGWWDFRRTAPVLLLHNRELDRSIAAKKSAAEVTAVLDWKQFPPELRDSRDVPWSVGYSPFLKGWRALLEEAGLDFDECGSDKPPSLDAYEMVVIEQPDGCEVAVDHPNVVSVTASAGVPLPAAVFVAGHPGVSLHHFRADDGRELLGALNSKGEAAAFVLGCEGPVTLVGRWRVETLSGDGGVDVSLAPYSAQIWEVRRG